MTLDDFRSILRSARSLRHCRRSAASFSFSACSLVTIVARLRLRSALYPPPAATAFSESATIAFSVSSFCLLAKLRDMRSYFTLARRACGATTSTTISDHAPDPRTRPACIGTRNGATHCFEFLRKMHSQPAVLGLENLHARIVVLARRNFRRVMHMNGDLAAAPLRRHCANDRDTRACA